MCPDGWRGTYSAYEPHGHSQFGRTTNTLCQDSRRRTRSAYDLYSYGQTGIANADMMYNDNWRRTHSASALADFASGQRSGYNNGYDYYRYGPRRESAGTGYANWMSGDGWWRRTHSYAAVPSYVSGQRFGLNSPNRFDSNGQAGRRAGYTDVVYRDGWRRTHSSSDIPNFASGQHSSTNRAYNRHSYYGHTGGSAGSGNADTMYLDGWRQNRSHSFAPDYASGQRSGANSAYNSYYGRGQANASTAPVMYNRRPYSTGANYGRRMNANYANAGGYSAYTYTY